MTAILSGNGDIDLVLRGSEGESVDITGANGSGGIFPAFIGVKLGRDRRVYVDGVENLRELRNALDHLLTSTDRVEQELRGL